MASLILVARTSSAPLKIKGNPSTLFTWLGWSLLPVAIIMSSRVLQARLYSISGFGFAIAKTIGSAAIDLSILGVTISATESPTKTSASTIASSKVSIFLCVANSDFSGDNSDRSSLITPLLSNITIFAPTAPKAL